MRTCNRSWTRRKWVLHDRPDARAKIGVEHARGRQRPQHQPEFVRAGLTQLLDRPENRHTVLFRSANAGVRISDKTQLDNTPVTSSTSTDGTPIPNVLGNIAIAKRVAVQSVYNQSNIQAVYDVYGSVEHRDLGSVAADIQKIVEEVSPQLKPGNHIVVRGQMQSMHSAFGNLTIGLLFAAVFVYMLMVVNYQSFLDPLAVVLALPGAGAGNLLMLFVTGTAISVPSLMGSIMAVGVASANSILLVTFARELRQTGMNAFQAALRPGRRGYALC